ncbi:MAG: VWA domain-containing protein [Desulfovibrio sp.]|nr:VWA domain-containing protein [Desulfovibrio sp.]
MKQGLAEIVFILDRSGSMHGLEEDTIGGFNNLIHRQKEDGGEALVSTVLFDDVIEVIHDRVPLESVPELTEKEYFVRGTTALLDALGGGIRHIGYIHKHAPDEERPEKTLFVITTDGLENASRRYRYAEIKYKVERQQRRYGWEFLFLGANMDAISEAAAIGIRANRAVRYLRDRDGTVLNYDVMHDAIRHVRFSSSRLPNDWKRRIEEDMDRRGGDVDDTFRK